jgi:hypothetical protein
MRAGVRTIAILLGLLVAVPALAGSLAELLRSPAYMGKRIQVIFLVGGTATRIGKLIDSGDDYLVLDIANASTAAPSPAQSPKPNSNYFDQFDPPAYQPSGAPTIVIPFSAILYVRLQGN